MVTARGRIEGASCPSCGRWSTRVHDRYQRLLVDGGVDGRGVRIRLTVRRFRCLDPACAAATFAEQVEGLTRPYARFTDAVEPTLVTIGMALAGRAGARLALRLGTKVSRMTLLRRVRAVPDPPLTTVPVVLGADEFALKKGHVYASVLIDMATRRPVDVIPDRDAETFAAWLREHPGVEVICRDRAGGFAEGGKAGAPDAIHVADRWHLLHNLGEAVERSVSAHRDCLRDLAPAETLPTAVPDPPPRRPDRVPHKFSDRVHERHAAVHELLDQGRSIRAIAGLLNLGRHTVQRYARAESPFDMLRGQWSVRTSGLDPFKEYLHLRLSEGCTNAKTLHRELSERGYAGSYSALRDYIRVRRPTARTAPAPTPGVRKVASWILTAPDRLDEADAVTLKAIRNRCPELDGLVGYVRRFVSMAADLNGHLLDAWINTPQLSGLPPLASFARGLLDDYDAVLNGLSLPYSSGACEGNVNRIKKIKRDMYGRANLGLLRARVLHDH